MLEDHADPATRGAQVGGRQRRHVLAIDDDPPGIRAFQPIDRADQGRLARARASDHAEHLTGLDRQIDRVQRHALARRAPEALGHPLEPDHQSASQRLRAGNDGDALAAAAGVGLVRIAEHEFRRQLRGLVVDLRRRSGTGSPWGRSGW